MEKKLGEKNDEFEKLLKDVPEEELLFTVEEITALGLDWTTHEMLANYMKNYAGFT